MRFYDPFDQAAGAGVAEIDRADRPLQDTKAAAVMSALSRGVASGRRQRLAAKMARRDRRIDVDSWDFAADPMHWAGARYDRWAETPAQAPGTRAAPSRFIAHLLGMIQRAA